MFSIHCPYCKEPRDQNEFSPAGEAFIARPENPEALSDEVFVFVVCILCVCCFFFFFFFKQKTAYEIRLSLVGSEMCIRDRSNGYILLGVENIF